MNIAKSYSKYKIHYTPYPFTEPPDGTGRYRLPLSGSDYFWMVGFDLPVNSGWRIKYSFPLTARRVPGYQALVSGNAGDGVPDRGYEIGKTGVLIWADDQKIIDMLESHGFEIK